MMAPASTCTREGAKPAVQGAGAEGLGRRGERSFDSKVAAHASEPRCVRTARAGSAHLHVSQHATSSLSEPAGSKGGSGRLLAVTAGAAETAALAGVTAALAGETVAMAAVVAEAAGAADAMVPQAVQAAVARAAAVVPAVVMAAAAWQRR